LTTCLAAEYPASVEVKSMKMKKTAPMNRLITFALSAALVVGMTMPALAEWERAGVVPWEEQAALEYLAEKGILKGDDNGDMNPDKGLTRSELAAVLWRLDDMDKTDSVGETLTDEDATSALEAGRLGFTDVPDWAKQYVMYCKLRGLMQGYSDTTFGSGDTVSVKAICTVILRQMGYSDDDGDWTYDTSLAKAQTVGIAPALLEDASSIRRGDMAIIVYRAETDNLTPVIVPVPPDGNYSKEANPDVFDDRIFTRELYNALRAAYLGYANNDIELRCRIYNEDDLQTLLLDSWSVLGDKGSGKDLIGQYKYISVNPYVAGWQIYSLSDEAVANRDTFIASLQGLSDMEKVERINQYISDHITYAVTLAGNNWSEFFTSGIVGDCENYGHAVNYLFRMAGISCIPTVGYIQDNSAKHLANMIYINDSWEFYDAASSESLGTLVFGAEGEKSIEFKPVSPRLNRFAMEAVRPGSTK
jgi:hypothetical protein